MCCMVHPSDLKFCSVENQDHSVASTRKEKHPIMSHKCTSFTHGEEQITLNQSKVVAGTQALSRSESDGESYINEEQVAIIDMRSRLLHRSLVEEVNKRRLFKTYAAVENIGYQTSYEITSKKRRPECGNLNVTNKIVVTFSLLQSITNLTLKKEKIILIKISS
jgi:WNK lysine deficient protein kinase